MMKAARGSACLLLLCLLVSVLTSCAGGFPAHDAEETLVLSPLDGTLEKETSTPEGVPVDVVENTMTVPAVEVVVDSKIEVTYRIVPADDVHPISPYIYGSNQDLPGFEGWTMRRLGGNRTTGYNWENNASNAGKDWYHVNDGWLCDVTGVTPTDCNEQPAAVMRTFHDQSLGFGAESIITLQMAGYVAADKNNEVSEAETAPSPRWIPVEFQKNTPYVFPPDPEDGVVYMDELLMYLTDTYGKSSDPQGIWGYALDNEPALWSSTHPYLHPENLTVEELLSHTVALSQTIKTIDPDALVFGPALYGFSAYHTLQEASDLNALDPYGKYSWFIDQYLDQMRLAEEENGQRLLDVLDLHWYSEADANGNGVTSKTVGDDAVREARMHAPRTLWDKNYRELSWIARYFPSYLPLLPRVFNSLDLYYPGTKLAFTEWGYGGESDISGGIAAADVLGIFGKYGVFAASHWSTGGNSDYVAAAFSLFRNYDGAGGTFGELSVKAVSSDISVSTIYAAQSEEGEGKLHLILFNKSLDQDIQGKFILMDEERLYTSARIWAFNEESPRIMEMEPVSGITDNQFSYTIPPLTAVHVVLEWQP